MFLFFNYYETKILKVCQIYNISYKTNLFDYRNFLFLCKHIKSSHFSFPEIKSAKADKKAVFPIKVRRFVVFVTWE